MAHVIQINEWLSIDDADIELAFIRSAGPGGQNVNRVASAVQLRFKAQQSRDLPPWVFERLKTVAGQRLNNLGEIVITARRHRTQEANRDDAFARLRQLLSRAATREAKRVPTKPTLASKQRRLEGKKRQGLVKASRSKPLD